MGTTSNNICVVKNEKWFNGIFIYGSLITISHNLFSCKFILGSKVRNRDKKYLFDNPTCYTLLPYNYDI
jgi:hypothetical protein